MNQSGYFTWYPENGLDLIHPDDIGWFEGGGVQGVVGTISTGTDGWAIFTFGKTVIRLKPELVHPCGAPIFSYGQRVQALPPRTLFVGEVRTVKWHFERQEPFYLVGLKHSRYFEHELGAA